MAGSSSARRRPANRRPSAPVAIGASLLTGVAAVFLSNVPESRSAATGLRTADWSPTRILLLWLGVAAISALSTVS